MKPADLFRPLLRHKKITLALLLLVLLGAGGAYGWKVWQYTQTPACAVDNFRTALHPLNLEKLARCVDFNAITGALARAIMEQEAPADNANLRFAALQKDMQAGLWNALTEDPEKAKAREADKNAPISPLPADFATQIAENMRYLPRAGMLLVQTSFRHPAEPSPVPLLLLMQQNAAGEWRVGELLNARELLTRLNAARQRQAEAKQAAFLEKNEEISRAMRKQLEIQHCEASSVLLSDKATLLTVVRLLARNKGEQTVNNTNANVELRDAAGKILLSRHMNSTRQVHPGEDFDHRWTLELDADSPEGKAVRAAAKLQCDAEWNSMLLDNGKLLYLRTQTTR